eukprot:g3212.t1
MSILNALAKSAGSSLALMVLLAQEWYREEAVGKALNRATFSVETNPLSSNGGQALKAGDAEEGVGGARQESGPAATLSRQHVFVTTKIHPRDYGAERIGAVVAASSTNLRGIDLLLLHSPFCWPRSCPDNPTPWQDAWRELEKLYSSGAVRAIGVSNFSEGLLRELLMLATVVPAAVQNWMDPFHQDKVVRALCAEHGIAYIAYSTLGGQWTYRPSSSSSANPVSSDPTLGAIAAAHDTSVQAVALSWALQNGAMILPRSSNLDRIRENLRLFVRDAGEVSSCAGDGAASRLGDGGGMGQGDRAGESGGGQALGVFLTDDEVRAIDLLDGTIGS